MRLKFQKNGGDLRPDPYLKECLDREPVSTGVKFTPLHQAAAAGYNGIVNLLLEYGANVETTNRGGGTAKDADTVKLLKSKEKRSLFRW